MLDIFYVIIPNLFRTFVIYRFVSAFYGKKRSNVFLSIAACAFFFSVTAGIHIFFHNVFLNILSNLMGMFVLTLLYESTVLKRVLLTFMIYLVNMACDGFVVIAFYNYKMGNEVVEIYSILTTIFLFFVELIVEYFFVEKEEFSIPLRKAVVFLCIPVVSGIMIVGQISRISSRIITIITISGILILNILLFYLYNSILKYYRELYSMSLMEKQIAAYANQLSVMEISQKENASLRHDMKHHIWMIRDYASEKDLAKIGEYLESLEKEYFARSRKYVNTGNKEIDSILNYMLLLAEKNVGKVSYKINIPEQMFCDIVALNIILGNLLENAIHAAKDIEDGFVDLKMSVERGILYIKITNSYSGNLKTNKKGFITTKEHAEQHGIGLKNVKNIIDKNKGELRFNYSDNVFEVRVLFYLKNEI